MDHDSIRLDLKKPSSHRALDIRVAYTEMTLNCLAIVDREITHNGVYRSNENGHFAWDLSMYIRAACLAWRVTGNPDHLSQATRWAKHIIDRTDERLGVHDWRGTCGATWSAGARYTAATTQLGQVGPASLHLQGAVETITIERPNKDTAIVRALLTDGREWTSPRASLLANSENYLPDVLSRYSAVHAIKVRGLLEPIDLLSLRAGEFPLEQQFASHLVHTAMIARSLIEVAISLKDCTEQGVNPAVSPDTLLDAAEIALQAHDHDIRVSQGQPWYIMPEDFPGRRLGLDLPHNHIVDAATSFMLLGAERRNDQLTNFGRSLAQRFLKELRAYDEGALVHPWHYYPFNSKPFTGTSRATPIEERIVPAVPRAEDSSHATLRARALAEWKSIDDTLVSNGTMEAVALSFRRHFMTKRQNRATIRWLANEVGELNRLGQTNTYIGAWAPFSQWDSTMKNRLNSLAHRCPPESVFGATVLSSAEIMALNTPGTHFAFARH